MASRSKRDTRTEPAAVADCSRRLGAEPASREHVLTVVPRQRFLPDVVEHTLVVALRGIELACAFAHHGQVDRHVAGALTFAQRAGADDHEQRTAGRVVAFVEQADAVARGSSSAPALWYAGRPVDVRVDGALQPGLQIAARRGYAQPGVTRQPRPAARSVRTGQRGRSRPRRAATPAWNGPRCGAECQSSARGARTRSDFAS